MIPRPAAFLLRACLLTVLLTMPAAVRAQDADLARSEATVRHTLRPPVSDREPAVASTTGRLPLVDRESIDRSARDAAGAAPSGVPGRSDSSPDGRRVVPGYSGKAPPPAFGTSKAPYTTARVAVTKLGDAEKAAESPVTSYPYRATGKLEMRFGNQWFICSASLIKRSVLITAAHCVFDYGLKDAGWADEVWFSPANYSKKIGEPYGRFSAKTFFVPFPYYDGTDTCSQVGVVCNNDIATVVLNPLKGERAGDIVGWYSYAWDGYSYKASSFLGNVTTAQITELGYPGAFDGGLQMQRTDAVGWYVQSGNLLNTEIGSAQTGGSSGGPWLVNFGTVPKVSSDADRGSDADMAIIGVTSWGALNVGYNRQGASFFGRNKEFPAASYGGYGAGNIGKLVFDTCKAEAAAC